METKAKENIDYQEPPVKRVKIMEQYECNICGASFETVQQLKNHFSIHQDENKEEEYDPSNEAENDDPLMQKALGNALNPSFTNSSCTTKVTHNIIHKYM